MNSVSQLRWWSTPTGFATDYLHLRAELTKPGDRWELRFNGQTHLLSKKRVSFKQANRIIVNGVSK